MGPVPIPHPHITGQEQMSVEENKNGQIGDAFHVGVIKMFVTLLLRCNISEAH